MIYNLILSGGSGTRLWPLSTRNRPKQYIPILNGRSLYQECLLRNKELVDATVVVLHKDQVRIAKEQSELKGIEFPGFVVEQEAKNTAPAIALAALSIDPDAILFVTPADHIIEADHHYIQCVSKACQLAAEGNLVTFGIQPTYPETGYGYIQHEGHNVIAFHEKPNIEIASEYLSKGGYLWNSGMFCFSAGTYLEALAKYQPQLLEACKKVHAEFLKNGEVSDEIYSTIPSVSIDNAVMEHAKNIKVIPSSFDWTDVGSFDALSDYLQKKNHSVENLFTAGANSNFIINEGKKPIALIGVEDIMVIQTEEGMLICKKGESQKVKDIYNDMFRQSTISSTI
ncbi:MAG: mannose-1-phosphate guanylyltransferase [Flavitalea sp.]